MSDTIRLLSTDLINKIAAGEVVERPASVVKELVENAIDAKASEISLKIEQSGIQLIEVSDNGKGMDQANAQLALVEHATSKISTQQDLERISTLGFRGEALASIASVSQMQIHTYDGETQPVLVTKNEDTVMTKPASGRNQGTTVQVKQLFANLPARRKFLRSLNTEFKHIYDTLINLALINPQVHFKFFRDQKLLLDLTRTATVLDRILQVHKGLSDKLIELSYVSPQIKISGYIGHPDTSRFDKSQQYIFINQRPVNDSLIRKAVKEGFKNSLMLEREPVFLIYIDLDPDLVDVNVHPRKLEVRFTNPGLIFQAIKSSVTNSLQTKLKNDLHIKFKNNTAANHQFTSPIIESPLSLISTREQGINSVQQSLSFTKNLLSENLSEDRIDERSGDFLTQGFLQVFLTYIVVPQNDLLLVIDQHAADERINFERIEQAFNTNQFLASQPLLLSEEINLSSGETATLSDNLAMLKQYGFYIEQLSSQAWQLTQVPEILAGKDYLSSLQEIISSISTQKQNISFNKLAATLACHSSIRAGQRLHDVEINQLISNLFKCHSPYSCPHGRPIIWEISKNELEKKFKRVL